MQVKEIDINTGKIKGYGICKKKYKISFLGGPTTPTYSSMLYLLVAIHHGLAIVEGHTKKKEKPGPFRMI